MITENSFPKVLIIGETFRYTGGGGITLINLFKDWNSDSLAVVTERIQETTFKSNCKKIYILGRLEIKVPFPFNLINKIHVSGEIKIIDTRGKSKDNKQKGETRTISKIKFQIEKGYYKLLIFLGLYNSNYQIIISEQLIRWIKDYSPDIIYAQPFRYIDMVFAKKLKELTGIPLAIHIMDDSVSFLNKPNLLYYYWRKRINDTFKQLVESADIHLSISDAMSDEYLKRYNKHFIPFRNPIEISSWDPYIKRDWSFNGDINIIYTGRLAVPNINALYIFCKVVEKLNNFGYSIKLHIYSIDINLNFNSKINSLKSIVMHKVVSSDEIPTLIPKFDLTFLPIDFTSKGIKYAKFSISTKTSEYMISGVPIILFAPKQVALTVYAEKYKCMYPISENNVDELYSSMEGLLKNEVLRATIAQNAIKRAKVDSNAVLVRNNFQTILSRKTILL